MTVWAPLDIHYHSIPTPTCTHVGEPDAETGNPKRINKITCNVDCESYLVERYDFTTHIPRFVHPKNRNRPASITPPAPLPVATRPQTQTIVPLSLTGRRMPGA